MGQYKFEKKRLIYFWCGFTDKEKDKTSVTKSTSKNKQRLKDLVKNKKIIIGGVGGAGAYFPQFANHIGVGPGDTQAGTGGYIGGVPKGTYNNKGIKVESRITLDQRTYTSFDQGKDEDGNIIWGDVEGPFIFKHS